VPLQAESLAAFLQALPEIGLSGFSVTRPYKQSILPQLAECENEATLAGSVNTVVVRPTAVLSGSSTDGDGVLLPLQRRVEVRGRRVAILGAGGAARAAAQTLARAGARVTVLSRRPEQAEEVAVATGCAPAALDAFAALEYDVLLNATPVGSGALPGALPVPRELLRAGDRLRHGLRAAETPLLAAAAARGCETIRGVEMLVAQAAGQLRPGRARKLRSRR